MEKRYLTLNDLCEYVSVKPSTIYWMVLKRTIPFVKLSGKDKGRLRFDKVEIDKWLKEKGLSFDDIKKV